MENTKGSVQGGSLPLLAQNMWLWFSYKRQCGRGTEGRDWRSPRLSFIHSFVGLFGWDNSNSWGLCFPSHKWKKKLAFFTSQALVKIEWGHLDPVLGNALGIWYSTTLARMSGWKHWQQPMLNLSENALKANQICWNVFLNIANVSTTKTTTMLHSKCLCDNMGWMRDTDNVTTDETSP